MGKAGRNPELLNLQPGVLTAEPPHLLFLPQVLVSLSNLRFFLHYYTMILQHIKIIVGVAGFETGTSASEVCCATSEPLMYITQTTTSLNHHIFQSHYISQPPHLSTTTSLNHRISQNHHISQPPHLSKPLHL